MNEYPDRPQGRSFFLGDELDDGKDPLDRPGWPSGNYPYRFDALVAIRNGSLTRTMDIVIEVDDMSEADFSRTLGDGCSLRL
jgi:hypothetical protein